jgi:hypothetical protein
MCIRGMIEEWPEDELHCEDVQWDYDVSRHFARADRLGLAANVDSLNKADSYARFLKTSRYTWTAAASLWPLPMKARYRHDQCLPFQASLARKERISF